MVFNSVALAVEPPKVKGDYVYKFMHYYDKGQLFGDRDYEIKYEISPKAFASDSIVNEQTAFRGEITNFKDQVIKTFKFDPQKGDGNFTAGKIVVEGPYVADGMRASFYSPSNQHLLSISIDDSSFCNDDLSCDASKGEDNTTCPLDCKKTVKRRPVDVKVDKPAQEEPAIGSFILYVVFVISAASGGWFGWKWWQDRNKMVSTSGPSNYFDNQNDKTQ